ncbi:EamA-like transporter family protein [Mesorhizobium sp. NBSH29]|uniref:DMT family transporter n=1 Tax=Mesorhizobium sp. NBSH29 TaxID=2654249 RepID=UPI0018964DB5|nr:DMT family transporter [Mesorhizobium sp. NBSH29]QPC87794.1 EamA-like transporter family protein [Mesorhizobium sp. NBSH29]
MTGVLWSLLGILAGAFIAIQAPVNAALARGLGLPVAAAAFSFLAGAVVLGIISLVMVRLDHMTIDFKAPALWLFIAGGILGAGYVTSAVILTPKLGAAALMAFLVTGQLLAGMLIDKVGFLGVAVREISAGRMLGAVLLLSGALLIRLT